MDEATKKVKWIQDTLGGAQNHTVAFLGEIAWQLKRLADQLEKGLPR